MEAHVLFSVGITCPAELADLIGRLKEQGFPTEDLSGSEAAQVGLGFLVFALRVAKSLTQGLSCQPIVETWSEL